MRWQIQEAKQRFSEVLRAAHSDGPQLVTKHGEEVAVVIDINEYRKLMRMDVQFVDALLTYDADDDTEHELLEEVIAERKLSHPREFDL